MRVPIPMSDDPTTRKHPPLGYAFLLLFLFLLVLIGPASAERSLRVFLVLGVLTTATWSIAEVAWVRFVGLALALVISGLSFAEDGGELGGLVLGAGYAFLVNAVVLRNVLRSRYVTANTICGALACFLMLALSWSLLFGLVEHLSPGSFAGLREDPTEGLADLYYFSIVTITTLGYGDITPVSGLARNLAATEALIGQFFLVVLVARLVALQIVHEHASGEES